jgi:hypothetical protein
MAHGCIPILSNLPANHELVRSGDNGLVLADGQLPSAAQLQPLADQAGPIAQRNHDWVREHALFAPAVAGFLARLQDIAAGGPGTPVPSGMPGQSHRVA